MQLTLDHLLKISRKKTPNANMKSIIAGLDFYGEKAGLFVPHRLAQYVPQIGHESQLFKHDREVWGPTPAQKRYDTRTDLGNTAAVDGDGKKYSGKTAIQITGRANTKAFYNWCKSLGLNPPDFVKNPELMNTDPWEGLGPIWYWDTRKLNKYADSGDTEMITYRINGGKNGLNDRLKLVTRTALVFLNYPVNTDKIEEKSLIDFQTKAKEQGLYAGTIDGIDGPRTRSALHMTLARLADSTVQEEVTAAPVVEETEILVPEVPKNADKTLLQRLTGLFAFMASIFAFFGDFDQTGKLILLAVSLITIGILFWRGELIAMRARSILKVFEEKQ